jgi:hypothetical protein
MDREANASLDRIADSSIDMLSCTSVCGRHMLTDRVSRQHRNSRSMTLLALSTDVTVPVQVAALKEAVIRHA